MLATKHLVIATYDYTDWKVNADYAFNDNFSAGAFYTDTDQDKAYGQWVVRSWR